MANLSGLGINKFGGKLYFLNEEYCPVNETFLYGDRFSQLYTRSSQFTLDKSAPTTSPRLHLCVAALPLGRAAVSHVSYRLFNVEMDQCPQLQYLQPG